MFFGDWPPYKSATDPFSVPTVMKKLYKEALELFYKIRDAETEEEKQLLQARYDHVSEEVAGHQEAVSWAGYNPYPSTGDGSFNVKLMAKREFNQYGNAQNVDSCVNTDFVLSNTQKFLRNFLSPYTPYTGVLIFHGVGVGKTCTSIQIAESFKLVFNKRVLVLSPPSIKHNFQRQIFDPMKGASQCTGAIYQQDSLPNAYYDFMGYIEFSTSIANLEKGFVNNQVGLHKKLREIYSNRVIIIDEAHNLRKVQNKNKGVSQKIEMVLRTAENVKLVLLSATPLYNDVEELVFLMELLLINDRRFDMLDRLRKSNISGGSLTAQDKVLLAEFSSRYMSYMRGENPYTFPTRLWPTEARRFSEYPTKDIFGNAIHQNDRVKLMPLVIDDLSPLQSKCFEAFLKQAYGKRQAIEDDDSMNVQQLMQVTNMVFPNDDPRMCIGQEGFSSSFKEVKVMGGRAVYSYKNQGNEFLHPKKIHRLSPKMAHIVDSIIKADGVVLVYSRFLYSGLVPLAFALEHAGFTNMRSNLLHVDVKPRALGLKYAIVSGTTEFANPIEKVMSSLNSGQNADGSILKVVLISEYGAEGVDYKNIRQLHIMEPWYNLSRIEQIIGRGVRNCSHAALPPAKRTCTIYLHATVAASTREAIDLHVYRKAERKQVHISEIERVLKENALDCQLNWESLQFPKSGHRPIDVIDSQGNKRTVHPGDVDFSRACDFMRCDFKCAATSKIAGKQDESTFERFFVEKDIDYYKSKIRLLFATEIALTYPVIMERLGKVVQKMDEFVLKHALVEMVNQLYHIDHKNVPGYLIYRSDKYVFQPSGVEDTKLTVQEREYVVSGVKNNRVTKVSISRLMDTFVGVSDAGNLITKIEQLATELSARVPEKVAIDFAIDLLNEEDMSTVALHVLSHPHRKILTSLEEGFVVVDKKYYFNYFNGKVLDSKGNQMSEFSGKKIRQKLFASVEKASFGIKRVGFIKIKHKRPQFKLIDVKQKGSPELTGVVCLSYPQLKKDRLEALILQLRPDWAPGGNKQELCNLYELALRADGRSFMRPVMAMRANIT